MSAGEWIALGGLFVGLITLAVSFVVAAVKVSFRFGEHHTRLGAVEALASDVKAKTEEHNTAIAGIPAMLDMLREVRDDVKGLMTGRTPVRRQREGD